MSDGTTVTPTGRIAGMGEAEVRKRLYPPPRYVTRVEAVAPGVRDYETLAVRARDGPRMTEGPEGANS
jgi:hypothetical protein